MKTNKAHDSDEDQNQDAEQEDQVAKSAPTSQYGREQAELAAAQVISDAEVSPAAFIF